MFWSLLQCLTIVHHESEISDKPLVIRANYLITLKMKRMRHETQLLDYVTKLIIDKSLFGVVVIIIIIISCNLQDFPAQAKLVRINFLELTSKAVSLFYIP